MNYWHQQGSEPLFPDLIWSKPVTKKSAGKLLIIGGQAQEFSGVASSFMAADKAGAGTVRVLMPDSTEKVTRMLPNIEYAPSNPSGSFSRAALASFLELSNWADHVLIAGDLGKNSETTTILDGYLLKCARPVTIAQDALESIRLPQPQLMLRPAVLVLDLRGLQRLGIEMELAKPITSTIGQPQLAELLHELTESMQAAVVCQIDDTTWVSSDGHVSSTRIKPRSLFELAATTSVWTMQQPTKRFEALSSSLLPT